MSADYKRIQKIIAESGFASRRKSEQLIEQGRVTVNGVKVELGAKATSSDQIQIDGKYINTTQSTQAKVILLNKPEGYITTTKDPKGRKTVFELLPNTDYGRWISIGRLDINTSGLLLFTTDGQLAHQLMHPAREIEREYLCRVYGDINNNKINELKSGIKLKNEKHISAFQTITVSRTKGRNHWVKVTLKQGKYREVRRLWQAVDCQVNRLTRIRYGSIRLPRTLPKGNYLALTAQQIQQLT